MNLCLKSCNILTIIHEKNSFVISYLKIIVQNIVKRWFHMKCHWIYHLIWWVRVWIAYLHCWSCSLARNKAISDATTLVGSVGTLPMLLLVQNHLPHWQTVCLAEEKCRYPLWTGCMQGFWHSGMMLLGQGKPELGNRLDSLDSTCMALHVSSMTMASLLDLFPSVDQRCHFEGWTSQLKMSKPLKDLLV